MINFTKDEINDVFYFINEYVYCLNKNKLFN